MADLSRYSSTGNFLTQHDVPQPMQLTIASTGEHQFGTDPAKLVLNWQQPVKPMACNKTVVQALQSLYGVSQEEQLIGLTVEVFNDATVQFQGKITGGLRIRKPANVAPQYPQAQSAQQLVPQPQQTPPQGGQWS